MGQSRGQSSSHRLDTILVIWLYSALDLATDGAELACRTSIRVRSGGSRHGDLPCAQKLEGSSPNGYAAAMSEAAPLPVEPPEPTPEQLAEWRALVERVRDGDRSEVVSWDQAAAELGL
jgi:hypothetical protein